MTQQFKYLYSQISCSKFNLSATLTDSRGGFQIRSKEELEKLKQEREAQAQMTAGKNIRLK